MLVQGVEVRGLRGVERQPAGVVPGLHGLRPELVERHVLVPLQHLLEDLEFERLGGVRLFRVGGGGGRGEDHAQPGGGRGGEEEPCHRRLP